MIKYKLTDIDTIHGMQWVLRESVTSFNVLAVSVGSVFQMELMKDGEGLQHNERAAGAAAGGAVQQPGVSAENSLLSRESATPARTASPSGSGQRSRSAVTSPVAAVVAITSKAQQGSSGGNTNHNMEYTELCSERILPVFSFHGGAIHSLSSSARTNCFITASFDDSSVRVWDYNKLSNFTSNTIIETFIDRHDENPFHVEIHPSGMFVAFATESEVREFAITDAQLELIRRISVRAPFTGPNGMPYLITAPVSIVRYSNGGHILAVVTGKLVQLFHLMVKDFTTSNLAGNATRSFVLCDHMAAISDLAFSRDRWIGIQLVIIRKQAQC
jgi:WD40 repeat protein